MKKKAYLISFFLPLKYNKKEAICISKKGTSDEGNFDFS